MSLALQTLRSDETLDLGGLGVVRLALTGDSAADDELADVVLLVKTEETADLGGTLGTKTLGLDGIGKTRELALTLLDDSKGHDSEILTGDGTTDRLALALTSAAGAVAAVSSSEEETGTVGEKDCQN